MVGNHIGAFWWKYALLLLFRGTNSAFQRKMVGEGFEVADSLDSSPDLRLALAAILFSGVVEGHPRNISVKLF